MAFAGNAATLENAMEENHKMFPHKTLQIKHIVEEGDLVAIHSHVCLRQEESGIATFHLFRFENDRIIEMWDIGQVISGNSPNKNDIF